MRHNTIMLFAIGAAITAGFQTGCTTCDLRTAPLARSYRGKNVAVIDMSSGRRDGVKCDGISVTWDTSNPDEMTRAIERAMTGSTIYNIVDRSKLESVIAEQDLQKSMLVDPETAARAGKLAGLNSIVLVRPKGYCKLILLALYVSKTAQVRMIDVETASVVWSGQVNFTDFGFVPFIPPSLVFTSAENHMSDELRDELERTLFFW